MVPQNFDGPFFCCLFVINLMLFSPKNINETKQISAVTQNKKVMVQKKGHVVFVGQ